MRRIEFLINEVRQSTDNAQANGIPDWELVGYYNDAVSQVHAIAHNMSYIPDLFLCTEPKVYDFDGSTKYALPSDIYMTNAIELVEVRFGDAWVNNGFAPVKRIADVERPNFFGYFTRDNYIVFSLAEQNIAYQQFRVTYFRKLPRFDKRWGTVSSVTAGSPNTLNFVPGTVDPDYVKVNDVFSIVDSTGAVIQSGLQIVSTGSNVLTFTGTLTGISAGQFMVMGDFSTTKCELPDAMESYIQDYVRSRIQTRQNYADGGKQLQFTSVSATAIQELLSRKHKDNPQPVITDMTFLGY